MTLIVEDGTGLETAESYVSVAEADTYHLARGNAAWTGSDTIKEAALRRATTFIDSSYRSRWVGTAVNGRDQALAWPRTDAVDTSGDDIDDEQVPREVKQATMEAALRELATPGSLNPDLVQSERVLREKVGDLEVQYADVAGVDASRPFLTIVNDLVSGLLSSSGRTMTSIIMRA